MGIFFNTYNDVDLFEPNPNTKRIYIKSSDTYISIDDNFIKIFRHYSLFNIIRYGLVGERTIPLHQITSINISEPKNGRYGMLSITYPGAINRLHGMFTENTITFKRSEKEQLLYIKEIVEEAMILSKTR